MAGDLSAARRAVGLIRVGGRTGRFGGLVSPVALSASHDGRARDRLQARHGRHGGDELSQAGDGHPVVPRVVAGADESVVFATLIMIVM